MTAKVVKFEADNYHKDACIEILTDALEAAKDGSLIDVAIVAAIRDENGPQFTANYHGEAAYAAIVAGVSALEFDLHFRRYAEAEE